MRSADREGQWRRDSRPSRAMSLKSGVDARGSSLIGPKLDASAAAMGSAEPHAIIVPVDDLAATAQARAGENDLHTWAPTRTPARNRTEHADTWGDRATNAGEARFPSWPSDAIRGSSPRQSCGGARGASLVPPLGWWARVNVKAGRKRRTPRWR
jgi:hypothetical protein